MRTLIVSYLPGYPHSNTRILLDRFTGAIPGGEDTVVHDLLDNPAPIFTRISLAAYTKRDMMGESVDAHEAASLQPFDQLIGQVRAADVLVLAFPMHNFSMPAAVKAYFDAIMLNNGTWRYGPKAGEYTGLMGDKKALALSACGGVYDDERPWNFLTPLIRMELQFMGFGEIETILADAMMRTPELRDESLARSFSQAEEVAAAWYGAAPLSVAERTVVGEVAA